MGVLGSIGSAIDGIKGNKPKKKASSTQTTKVNLSDPTAFDKQLEGYLVKSTDNAFNSGAGKAGSQDQLMANQFMKMLQDSLSRNGFASDDAIAHATSFVDKTFTDPARLQAERSKQDYQSNVDARAAALGRQVDDIGYRNDYANMAGRLDQDINAQRGAQIQQRALDQSAGSLNNAALGSQFFNQRSNQMLQNQLGLLNAATVMSNNRFNQRAQLGGQTTEGSGVSYIQPTAGQRIGAIGAGFDQEVKDAASMAGSVMGFM